MEAAAHLFISKTLLPQWAPPHPLQLKASISVCEKFLRGKNPPEKTPLIAWLKKKSKWIRAWVFKSVN